MATSGDAIRDSILAAMALEPEIDETDPAVIRIAKVIGHGVYNELLNLDDTAGTPPSTGHQ